MKVCTFALSLLIASSVSAQTTRTPQAIADDLAKLTDEVRQLQLQPPQLPTPPDGMTAALAAGGVIHLQTGVTYTNNIVVRVSGTKIFYDGASSHPVFGPALEIPPGVNDVEVHNFSGTTDGQDRVSSR